MSSSKLEQPTRQDAPGNDGDARDASEAGHDAAGKRETQCRICGGSGRDAERKSCIECDGTGTRSVYLEVD